MKKIQLMTPFLNDVEISNLKKTLDSGWLTQGNAVKKFEEKFCNFHKVNYGAALTSATAGLHLALMAINLKLHFGRFLTLQFQLPKLLLFYHC